MGKKFNKWLRNMAKTGVHVGDLNQAYSSFKYGTPHPTPPAPQAAAPPPPAPTPDEIKPELNTTPRKLSSEDGDNLKIKKKSKKQRKALARGTGQLTIARDSGLQSAQGVSSGGLSV